jgi:ankyrin repeat protein
LMQDGMTPLHMAAEKGHTAIVEALLAAGAEVNVTADKVHIPPTLLPPLSSCQPRTRLIWRPLTGAGGGCVWGM